MKYQEKIISKKEEYPSKILEDYLFESRFIFIIGKIEEKTAKFISEKLISLSRASHKPIYCLISSPGGHIESGDVIHDMIKFISSPVFMIGSGWVSSAAIQIFLSVPKDHRFCLKNTRFLIHEPSGGIQGTATDIEIQAREILRIRERLAKIISKETNQNIEKVKEDIDRDHWMNAKEALNYGLISRVITCMSEIVKQNS